ncbi:ATP-binding cassette domain-containing protein [Corynebacterium sp. 4HC-13]|uniref:ATP-binding cassette domain-containing protein n=1 Tax=Corynebacterium anserum TaxID=2684406 RepID=UPI00163A814C|nr:ATP-binding cassette domain-containing protein [Corynebacterium anserum]MBC2682531.1 ATP-binding cassette domain-containing protein [Corynebacterium anserum]
MQSTDSAAEERAANKWAEAETKALDPTEGMTAVNTASVSRSDCADIISARDLQLKTKQGIVFSDVDLAIKEGSTHALVGPQGSGRTSLLLVLAGRMQYSGGELIVDGNRIKPGRSARIFGKLRAVQRISAIAGFRDIDDLDISTGVGEIVNERLGLISPLLHRAETWNAPRIQTIRALTIPRVDPQTWVRNLSAYEEFAMRITLALLDDPRILLVDNVDQLSNPEDQREAWEMLGRIQESGVTVVASTTNTETMPDWVDRTTTQRPYNQEEENYPIYNEDPNKVDEKETED